MTGVLFWFQPNNHNQPVQWGNCFGCSAHLTSLSLPRRKNSRRLPFSTCSAGLPSSYHNSLWAPVHSPAPPTSTAPTVIRQTLRWIIITRSHRDHSMERNHPINYTTTSSTTVVATISQFNSCLRFNSFTTHLHTISVLIRNSSHSTAAAACSKLLSAPQNTINRSADQLCPF